MGRRKNIEPEEDDSKEQMILIYKHNDECYIERGAYCYNLVVHSKRMYYPTIESCFKALSHALLVDHFGRIPNEEKTDIKRILRAIEDHDKMIKEMFKGY
jgi:hypothetical protein